MDNIGIRRYYIDELEMEAQVFIELKNINSKDEYFTKLNCRGEDVQTKSTEELFRFFSDNPPADLVNNTLKEMAIYWSLDIINNNSVNDSQVDIYKCISDNEFELVSEDRNLFKWGDIKEVSINKSTYIIKDFLVEKSPIDLENTYCISADVHGDYDFRVFYEARKAGYSNIFICGDFGYIWDGSSKEFRRLNYLSSIGINIYWVCGNHENFDLLQTYPVVELNGGKARKIRDNIYYLMRGEIFNFNNKKIFTFGGANSIDKHLRKEGVSWWPQEAPTEEEKDNARKNLANNDYKVDYIITHAPHTRALKDISSSYNADDVSDFLSEIYHTTDFQHWYFGHMHVNHTYVEGRSTCINKRLLHFDL